MTEVRGVTLRFVKSVGFNTEVTRDQPQWDIGRFETPTPMEVDLRSPTRLTSTTVPWVRLPVTLQTLVVFIWGNPVTGRLDTPTQGDLWDVDISEVVC